MRDGMVCYQLPSDKLSGFCLYCTGFPEGMSQNEMLENFDRIGPIHAVNFHRYEDECPQGAFYVQYVHPEDARQAQRQLDGFCARGMDKSLWIRPSNREFVLDSQYAGRQVNKMGSGSRASPCADPRVIMPDSQDCNNPWLVLDSNGEPDPRDMCVVRWGDGWRQHTRRYNEDNRG